MSRPVAGGGDDVLQVICWQAKVRNLAKKKKGKRSTRKEGEKANNTVRQSGKKERWAEGKGVMKASC